MPGLKARTTSSFALVFAKAGELREAARAIDGVPDEVLDIELLEELAVAAALDGSRREAWRFFRSIEEREPMSPSLQRLTDTGRFSFVSEWLTPDASSAGNYARGIGSGACGWVIETVQGVWHTVSHPIETAKSLIAAMEGVFKSLPLLLSPAELARKLGDELAALYWSAWTACKRSAAREYGLALDRYDDQKQIYEIAAGRMAGYFACELAVIVASAGAAAAASKAERAANLAKAAETEQRLQRVNLLGRSQRFLDDAARFPRLGSIPWLTEQMWEALKRVASSGPTSWWT